MAWSVLPLSVRLSVCLSVRASWLWRLGCLRSRLLAATLRGESESEESEEQQCGGTGRRRGSAIHQTPRPGDRPGKTEDAGRGAEVRVRARRAAQVRLRRAGAQGGGVRQGRGPGGGGQGRAAPWAVGEARTSWSPFFLFASFFPVGGLV